MINHDKTYSIIFGCFLIMSNILQTFVTQAKFKSFIYIQTSQQQDTNDSLISTETQSHDKSCKIMQTHNKNDQDMVQTFSNIMQAELHVPTVLIETTNSCLNNIHPWSTPKHAMEQRSLECDSWCGHKKSNDHTDSHDWLRISSRK